MSIKYLYMPIKKAAKLKSPSHTKQKKPKISGEPYLLDFYGTECPHCHDMDPLVERLGKEEGVRVKKIEVWHNAENAKLLESYDQGQCGGVPFFFNTKTSKWICGESSYEELKDWAK